MLGTVIRTVIRAQIRQWRLQMHFNELDFHAQVSSGNSTKYKNNLILLIRVVGNKVTKGKINVM